MRLLDKNYFYSKIKLKILTISGSTRQDSSNIQLLECLPNLFPKYQFQHYKNLDKLPLFRADDDKYPWHSEVLNWRKAVAGFDAVIICTPEYIHNIPALLKNALEWLTSSGELMNKPTLTLTFTPHEPRGEKAMQSLLWSLKALEARIVGQLALYQNEVNLEGNKLKASTEIFEMLEAALDLFEDVF